MTLGGKRLAVAIPDTVLEERDSLREKTVKLGMIARACAIYGVDVVQVYRDTRGRSEARLIRKVLEYLETPQYLRRRLYPFDEALRYAGLLPPLRIPSHKPKLQVEELELGEIREGVVNRDGTVDIGLERSLKVQSGLEPGSRVTVKVTSKNPFAGKVIDSKEAIQYWGYRVELRSVDEVLTDGRFDLKIATSRHGDALRSQLPKLKEAILNATGVSLIFGSPSKGLFEIVGHDLTKKVDFVLNLFLEQYVQTVRTEEAIFAGLNLVNNLSA